MAVSDQTRSGDLAETFKSERDTTKNQIRVALPGIVQSFDPDAVTAVVQPAIRSVETDNDGNRITKNYPLLVDVPVVFPRGGGCTLTFPVKAGDECLVIFADRCIDFWWQNGGVQEPVDDRVHDLSDAFCIVGPQSQAQKISGISTSAVELRSDDGGTKLSLIPSSGAIAGTAPGGFNLNGLKILPDGRLQLVDGSIVDKHTHGGVESGGSNTKPLGYRREDDDGDYTFGSGDDTWMINSPEAVAQAVKTRFELWYGQWFLDTTEGTPWIQSVLGKQKPETYNLAIRKRILETRGVKSILSFNTTVNTTTRRVQFFAEIDTIYGTTTVTSEA